MANVVLDEIKETVVDTDFNPVVVNFADDPNNPSVTTVGALPEKADMVKTEKEEKDSGKKKEVVDEKKDESTPSEPAAEKAEKKIEEKAASPKTEKKDKETEESLATPREDDPAWYKKRFREMTTKRQKLQNELEFERNKRIELEQEVEKTKNAIPAANKPKMEDFATEVEYFEALSDWKIESRLKQEREKYAKEDSEKAEKESTSAFVEIVKDAMEKGKKKYEDFEELVLGDESTLSMSKELTGIIIESDIAEDIFHYLAKNPDISEEIAELGIYSAAREIGKIEAKLLAPPPQKKKITNAPEPITPIRTTGVIDKDPGKMPMREIKEWVRTLKK